MTPERRASLQNELLRETVRYAYAHQEPYRRKMSDRGVSPEDIRGTEDLPLLPFVDKHDLLDAYPYGMLAAERERIVRLNASSGTTGKMTLVPSTAEDVEVYTESVCRAYAMQGCRPGFTVQNALSYSMFIGGMGVQNAVERLGGTVIPTSIGNNLRQLAFLRDLKPDNLTCTPSYALALIDDMEREGLTKEDFGLQNCLLCGEKTTSAAHKRIREKLGVRIFDVYGLAEVTAVCASCRYENGMHIPEDLLLVEIVDENGVPLPCGQAGEIVITTLQKRGQPLIRFRTHDVAVMRDDPCPCGRTSRRIEKILGRTDDMLTVKGCKLFPSQFEYIVETFPGLGENYRLTVKREAGKDLLLLQAECENPEDCTEKRENALAEYAKSIVTLSVSVRLLPKGSLPISDGLKIRHFFDERP